MLKRYSPDLEPYAQQARARFGRATPWRIGVMVGLAGVSLDRSGTPLRGTRWEHCYAWGVLWGERERARMRREGERA